MATCISILIQSLGWTLLHSLWQGALTAAVLWLILRLLPNIPARIRYHLSLSSFTFLFSWFLLTAYQQYQKLQTAIVTVTEANTANIPVKTYTVTATPSDGYTEHLLRPYFSNIEPSFTWLVTLYLCGILFMLARMAFSIRNVRTLKTKSILPSSPLLQQQLDILIQKLELTRNITLKLSHQIQSPMMMGFLKPIILLPFSIINQLAPDQLEAILLHELAHIKRQDYIVNIFQTIVETLLFFNPFMWRISNIIRREREHCCDDIVLSFTNNPLPYATALATLETIRINAPQTALAAAGKKQHLFIRIKRIMEMKKTSFSYNRQTAAVLLIAALGIGAICLTPSFAQSSKKKEVKHTTVTTQTQWIGSEKITIVEPTGLSHTYETLEDLPETERLRLAKEAQQTGMRTFYGPQNKEIVLSDNGKSTIIKVHGDGFFYKSGLPVPPNGLDTIQNHRVTITNLKKLSADTLQKNVSLALKELENINWDEISKDVQEGLKEVDAQLTDPKLKAIIEKEIANANQQSLVIVKKHLEDVKDELDQLNKNVKQQIIVQKTIADSNGRHISITPSPNTPPVMPLLIDKMLQQMAKEGIIEQGKKYTFLKKGNKLYINGKKQSQSIYNRYNQYFSNDDQTFTASIKVDDSPSATSTINKPNGPLMLLRIDDSSMANYKQNKAIVARVVSGPGAPAFHKMLEQMQKDGLIEQSKKYTFEKRGGKLYINGTLQSQQTYNRYKEYLDGNNDITFTASIRNDDNERPVLPPNVRIQRIQTDNDTKEFTPEKMLNRMERNGLINRKEKFKIEKTNNKLYINGKQQSPEVYSQYEPYLEDYSDVRIKGKNGGLEISVK